jgi:alkylation response protein AidB-like acyl-CoA dehydrogenase
VTIRPLRQITGDSNFNEVFFEDVHIPAENLVGQVNDGWRASITTLMNERVSIGSSGGDRDPIEPFVRAVREHGLDRDEVTRDEIASLFVRQRVQRYLGMRLKESLRAGRVPGSAGLGRQAARLHDRRALVAARRRDRRPRRGRLVCRRSPVATAGLAVCSPHRGR